MSVIRAHFDGRVFVPDEPVDCPAGTPLRLLVISDDPKQRPLADLADFADQFEDVPDWPADGAAETDHYLYGTPKRNA